jgi:glycine oxidase
LPFAKTLSLSVGGGVKMTRKRFDVAILGCGIIGSTIAIGLSIAGLNVLVIEHAALPLRGSTGAGFGALTPYSDPYFTGETALFAEKSLNLYRDKWLDQIQQLTGQKIPLSNSGLLQLFLSEAKMNHEINRFERDCIPGYRPKIMNAASIKQAEPAVSQNVVGAIFHPEPWIDLKQYMAAIEIALNTAPNLHLRLNSQIRNLEMASSGLITADLNEKFSFETEYLVVATGLENLRHEAITPFPIKRIRGDGVAIRTKDNQPLFRNNIYSSPAFISPRGNGEMLLGSTYVDEGLPLDGAPIADHETITFGSMQRIASSCSLISEQLQDCTIERIWRGWRPASEDDYPIFGPDLRSEKIIYAQAFLGLGITMSVAVADTISNYIVNGVDFFPKKMSPSRFSGVKNGTS